MHWKECTMVLPTYLGIKEAAKRIEQKCREPVTTGMVVATRQRGQAAIVRVSPG
jgi:hypothetical protein